MKGISRRARTCAVAAVTGVAVLASAGAAQAQRPASLGEGLPVGQTGMQMFNFSRYITGTAAEQKAKVEQIFQMLHSKGIKVVEPYSLHGMTASEMRELANKYDLRMVGRHGSVAEPTWDNEITTAKTLGQEFIGSGGTAAPGQGTYAQTLATAATLNRLGKRSVEAGVGKVYIHNHTAEFETKYDVNGVVRSAWEILMDNTDPRYVAAEVDAGWASDTPVDVVDLLNRYPDTHRDDARQGPHEHGSGRPQRHPRRARHGRDQLRPHLRRRQGQVGQVVPLRARPGVGRV